jgi:DNA-binding YbaB/EbfC family protein
MDKSMLRQAKQLQAKMVKIQEELGNITVEASSGGGVVKVVMDGHQNVQSVEILPEAVNTEDIEMLQDLIISAVNEAIAKSQEVANKQLSSITGGLNIPGLT